MERISGKLNIDIIEVCFKIIHLMLQFYFALQKKNIIINYLQRCKYYSTSKPNSVVI